MKKRIWNQLQSVTLAAVLVTGMAGSLWNESVGIRAAELTDGFSDSVRLEQSAVWTDEKYFKAQLQMKVSGLDTLRHAVQVESAGSIWDESQREEIIPPEELEALELAEESAEHVVTVNPVNGNIQDMGMDSRELVNPVGNMSFEENAEAGRIEPSVENEEFRGSEETENVSIAAEDTEAVNMENFADDSNHFNFNENMRVENMEEVYTDGNDNNSENESENRSDTSNNTSDNINNNANDDANNDTNENTNADTGDEADAWHPEGGYDRVEEWNKMDELEGLEGLLSEGTIEQSEGEPEKYFLTAYISEYFQIEEAQVPAGTQMETVVIRNQKGEETELTKLNYLVELSEVTEDSFQITFPVVLREEYQVSAVTASYPVCQDEPLQKDRSGMGTYFWGYAGGVENVLEECPSEKLSVKAAEAGTTAVLQADEEQVRAGQTAGYTLKVENTGKLPLENIEISSTFSLNDVKAVWESEQGFQVNGTQGVLSKLNPGEKRTVRLTLQLTEEQSGEILHTVTVKAKHPGKEESIGCQTSAKITAAALKAAFEVEKTADRKEAYPGDTITYQICIRNTGERTLHSVLSTERFLNANIQAQFVQKEGVTLNSTRTQALIPQIAPGEAFALYATVTLPQYFTNQELVNEVSVISDETGTETIRSQSNLTVNASETTLTPTPTMFPALTPTPAYQSYDNGYGAKTGNAYAAASKPKTGDETEIEMFLIMGIFAVVSGISGAVLMKKRREKRH